MFLLINRLLINSKRAVFEIKILLFLFKMTGIELLLAQFMLLNLIYAMLSTFVRLKKNSEI